MSEPAERIAQNAIGDEEVIFTPGGTRLWQVLVAFSLPPFLPSSLALSLSIPPSQIGTRLWLVLVSLLPPFILSPSLSLTRQCCLAGRGGRGP